MSNVNSIDWDNDQSVVIAGWNATKQHGQGPAYYNANIDAIVAANYIGVNGDIQSIYLGKDWEDARSQPVIWRWEQDNNKADHCVPTAKTSKLLPIQVFPEDQNKILDYLGHKGRACTQTVPAEFLACRDRQLLEVISENEKFAVVAETLKDVQDQWKKHLDAFIIACPADIWAIANYNEIAAVEQLAISRTYANTKVQDLLTELEDIKDRIGGILDANEKR